MIDITEINVSTGEIIERKYTKKEKDERAALQSNPPQQIIDMRSQDESLENEEFIALKQSAMDKLKALGLTEEEARALAGI